jgi:mRNA interferase MazF
LKIRQGDIFWQTLREPRGSEPRYRRPCVVVQSDVFNVTAINTVVCCALTANLFRAQAPGNLLLRKGEGNLPKAGVVNVSQIAALNRSDLTDKIGTLSRERTAEIYEGLKLLLEPRELE